MQKKSNKIGMFWTIKVQPLYKCNKFMLNLEQVAFNIIEERMEKPRTLGGKEHLCHCYACCQVTTAIFCTAHGNHAWKKSSQLGEKKDEAEMSDSILWGGVWGQRSVWDPPLLSPFQMFLTKKLTLPAFMVLIDLMWGRKQILWAAKWRLSSVPNTNRIIHGHSLVLRTLKGH